MTRVASFFVVGWGKRGYVTQKAGVCNTWRQKDLENASNTVYICKKFSKNETIDRCLYG